MRRSWGSNLPDNVNILPIRIWDDPALSKVCDKIEDNEYGPKLEEFGRELVATMNDRSGVGLAAPQVGVLKRMFVMVFPDHEEMPPLVACNPTLVLTGRTLPGREGCLSMPNVFLQIERATNAVMQYADPSGKQFEVSIDGMDARVAQHETDHIDGIFFISRVSRQMRRAALRDWEKIRQRYIQL